MKLKDNLDKCYDKNKRILSGSAQKLFISQLEDYDSYPGNSLSEKIYLLKNKMEQPRCPTCGKLLVYYKSGGYRDYCSNKCRSNNINYKKNRIGTGFQSQKVQNKIKKVMKQKYGVINAGQIPQVKEKIKEKLLKTNQEWRNSETTITNTIKRITNMGFKVLDIHQKNNETYYQLHCPKHNYNWEWSRVEKSYQTEYPICKHCHNEKRSLQEDELINFIKSIYNGLILENDRIVIKPKELDIYLPELKLAIEFNGLYWHGYHSNTLMSLYDLRKKVEEKRLLCQQLGIRLINIDECDWTQNKEVIKRFLIDQIVPRQRIFARNCVIKSINTKEAQDFCNYYHVNGYRGGSTKLGLYYKNELLIVAIFAKYKSNYECVRLCYKTGFDVIGGWAKIQKHFGKKFLHYVNLKYFQGENRTGIGFRFITKSGKVLHRNALQKKTGLYRYCKNVDTKLSDFNNCIANKMIAIFDCGNDIRWYN
jgi:hypothetical protein